jgi:hypothetical protein
LAELQSEEDEPPYTVECAPFSSRLDKLADSVSTKALKLPTALLSSKWLTRRCLLPTTMMMRRRRRRSGRWSELVDSVAAADTAGPQHASA